MGHLGATQSDEKEVRKALHGPVLESEDMISGQVSLVYVYLVFMNDDVGYPTNVIMILPVFQSKSYID